jgi:hypothetical protein
METTHQEQAQSSRQGDQFIPWIPTKDDQNRFIDDPRFAIAIALKNKRK